MKHARFYPLQPVQSAVIETLATQPALTIKSLYENIQRDYDIEISLANFYRSISQMIHHHVLVRSNKKISLNSSWIPHIIHIAESIKEQYFGDGSHHFFLEPGERRYFSADSLFHLDPIWSDMLSNCSALAQEKGWYIYEARPYYPLIMPKTESQLLESMLQLGGNVYQVFGGSTWLDRYGSSLITLPNLHVKHLQKHAFPKKNYIVSVIDTFIVECLIPDNIVKHFDFLFENTTSFNDFKPELFMDVFQMKANCKLTVRNDKKDAERIRSEIQKYFSKS